MNLQSVTKRFTPGSLRRLSPPPPPTMWTLSGSIERDSKPQTVLINKTPFRIGRRPDLELSLNSTVVSGRHAELFFSGGCLYVRDTNSTNGTFVNENKITGDVQLSPGDWVEFGDIHLKIGTNADKQNDSPSITSAFKTCRFDSREEINSIRGLAELFEQRSLAPCFQPIHCLKTHDVHGYEFLARCSIQGVTTPAEMFRTAQSTGREIELSMLCREQGVEHSRSLPARIPVFLNTHPNEPLMNLVVPQMRTLRSLQPTRPLVLEIHEAAVTDPALVRELRAALREFDVQLAFDDFGSGQARIRELICAPLDYIKFDAALIRDLQNVSKEQFNLFRSILNGIRSEGAITVAEGVENDRMMEVCVELEFDLVQGYALSRPTIMHPTAHLVDTNAL